MEAKTRREGSRLAPDTACSTILQNPGFHHGRFKVSTARAEVYIYASI